MSWKGNWTNLVISFSLKLTVVPFQSSCLSPFNLILLPGKLVPLIVVSFFKLVISHSKDSNWHLNHWTSMFLGSKECRILNLIPSRSRRFRLLRLRLNGSGNRSRFRSSLSRVAAAASRSVCRIEWQKIRAEWRNFSGNKTFSTRCRFDPKMENRNLGTRWSVSPFARSSKEKMVRWFCFTN